MLWIEGCSDDLIELEGIVSNEIPVAKGQCLFITVGDTKTGGIVVGFAYGAHEDPVWAGTILPIHKEVPCPWPVSVQIQEYSPVIEIDCPEGTPVNWDGKEDAEIGSLDDEEKVALIKKLKAENRELKKAAQ